MLIPNRKFLALLSASAVVVCLVEAYANRSILAGLAFLRDSPAAATMTLLLIASAWVVVDALIGVRRTGLLFLVPALAGLAYLSGEKLKYLSEPLYPWDFLFGRQLFALLPALVGGGSLRELTLSAGMLLLFLGSAVICLRCIRRSPAIGLAVRLSQGLSGAVILAALVYLLAPANAGLLHRAIGIQNIAWAQPHNYKVNGFVLGFALNINSALVSEPKSYTPERIALLPSSKPPPSMLEMGQVKPHVLLILSESFWDPTLLPGVLFSKDPMPVARKHLGNGTSGWLFSPAMGGGTANVEFEALTGFSNALLPSGSVPYQQYLHIATPSLPRLLKSLGYKTKAYHTFHKWFWNREAVYKHLGFDQFFGLEDLEPVEIRGRYPSDKQLLSRVREAIATSDQPTFAFVITMQNHGPYEANRYGAEQITATGNINDALGKTLGSYAQGIYDADEALGDLIQGVQNLTRPTIIIFFGDHVPYLGSAYRDTGFVSTPSSNRSAADILSLRRTPLIIWSNYDARLPRFTMLGAMFLPYMIARAVGTEHAFYTEMLGELL